MFSPTFEPQTNLKWYEQLANTNKTKSRSSGPTAHIQPITPKKEGPFAHIQPITPGKPKPRPLSALDKYLAGDSAYQQALRGNKRTLADFLSDLRRRRGEAGTQFKQTKSSMNRDSTDQLNDLREEFASRGLIQSGLYGKEQGNFRKKFGEQITSLNQQQTGLLADLMSQEKNYRREIDLANEAARQEAILRRTQRYNIGGKK